MIHPSSMAAATGASFFVSSFSLPLHHNCTHQLTSSFSPHLHFLGFTRHSNLSSLVRQSSISDTTPTPILTVKPTEIGRIFKKNGTGVTLLTEKEEEGSLKDFFELAESLVRLDNGVGPPRWLSPLGCSSRLSDNCPLLLYLPGQFCICDS